MQVKISRWGNSLALRLPRVISEETGLAEGQNVDVRAEEGRVVIAPVGQAKVYRLEDLVAEMRRIGRENAPPLEDWGIRGGEWPNEDWSDVAPKD